MRRHLYFICPTDHLETVVNSTFKQENYFLTSLGNTMAFDAEALGELSELMASRNISNITFVLADNNRIITDALKNRDFAHIRGMDHFYRDIARENDRAKIAWQEADLRLPILSYHLSRKAEELRAGLQEWMGNKVEINAKVFNRQKKAFYAVHAALFHREYYDLN